ncbi:uncharacterized protein LOC144707997 isoform X2 [Wolffia australiana]
MGSKGFTLGLDTVKEAQGADEKKSAVHAELDRMSQLPTNSSYAVHRVKVLNKLLHLLSVKEMRSHAYSPCVRTTSQDEELELLFAGLSL